MNQPWAAPGATAPQPAPAPPTGAGAAAPSGSHGSAGPARSAGPGGPSAARPVLPPLPVPLRPMTIPDVLDGAFAIIKLRPRDVLTLAVAFIVPIEVISAIILRDVLGSGGLSAVGDPDGAFAVDETAGPFDGLGPALVSIGISAASLALIAGALAHIVAAWYDGEDVRPGEAIVVALRRSPALLVALVLVHALELVGILGIFVGAYIVMALLHVVSPAVVAEGLGPFRALARSSQLTSRRLGASLAVPGLVGLIGALVGFGFQLIPELATLAVPDDWHWLVRSVGQMLSQLVVVPFTAGVAVLYHLDLRIRTEGHDIERRARVVFGG